MAQTLAEKAARKLQEAQGAGNLYSHSALSAFRECGFRWYGRYALGLKDGPGFHLAYGHLVHAVGSRAIRERLAGSLPAEVSGMTPWIAEARQRYSPAGGHECDEQALVPAEADLAIAETARAIVQALPQNVESVITEGVLVQPLPVGRAPIGKCDVPKLEELLLRENDKAAYFEVLRALKAARVNGIQVRPDATIFTPGAITFADWKTNRKRPGKRIGDLVAQYAPQLRFYAAVGRRRWPDRAIACDLHAFEFGAPAPVAATSDLLDEAAKLAVGTMRGIAAAAAQGEAGFGKQVGEACRYCHLAKLRLGIRPACPEGTAYRRAKGWDRYDEQDALARIRAGIAWSGDDPYRERLLAQGQAIARADAVAAGEAAAEDPVTAEVAGWTPEEAAAYARQVQYLERGAAAAKDLRPYIARYVQLRGPIALGIERESGLPAGTWALAGGKPKPAWTDDVAAIEAVATAAGLNPADYLRREIDPKALTKMDTKTMDAVALACEAALQAMGQDPASCIRRIPHAAALDEALKQPEAFELLQTLRIEKPSEPTLRFNKVEVPGPGPEPPAAASAPDAGPDTPAQPDPTGEAPVEASAASFPDEQAAAAPAAARPLAS